MSLSPAQCSTSAAAAFEKLFFEDPQIMGPYELVVMPPEATADDFIAVSGEFAYPDTYLVSRDPADKSGYNDADHLTPGGWKKFELSDDTWQAAQELATCDFPVPPLHEEPGVGLYERIEAEIGREREEILNSYSWWLNR